MSVPIRSPPTGILISYPILKEFPHSSPPPSTTTSSSPPTSGFYLGFIESYEPPSLYTPSSSTTNKRRIKKTIALDHGHYRASFLDGDINDYTPAEAWEGIVAFVEQYIAIIDDPYQTVPAITKKDVFGNGPRDIVTQQTMMEYWEKRLKSWWTKDSKDESYIGLLTREDVEQLDREWRECWQEYQDFMIKNGVLEPKGSLVDCLTGRVRSLLLLEEEGVNKGAAAITNETAIVEGVTMDDIVGTRILAIDHPEEEKEPSHMSTTTLPIVETPTSPSQHQQQQHNDNSRSTAKQTSSRVSHIEGPVEITPDLNRNASNSLRRQYQETITMRTTTKVTTIAAMITGDDAIAVLRSDTPDLLSANNNDQSYCVESSSSSSDVIKEGKEGDNDSKTDDDDDNFLMISPGRKELRVKKKGSMGGNEEMARTTKPPISTPSTLSSSSSSPNNAITPNHRWLCQPITNTHTQSSSPPLPIIPITPSISKPSTSGECDVCLFTFPHLSEHRFAIHRLTPSQYVCPYCDVPERGPWKTPQARLRHIIHKHPKHATKALEIPSSTRPPEIWLSGASYRCPFCPFRSTNSGLMGVDYHIREKHKNFVLGEYLEDIVKRFCPFCRPGINKDVCKIFHSREELERHVREGHEGCQLLSDEKLPGIKSLEGKVKKRKREENKIKMEKKKGILEKETVKKQRQQPIKRKKGRAKKGSGSDVPMAIPPVVTATLGEEPLPSLSPRSSSTMKKTHTKTKTRTKKIKPSKSPSHTNAMLSSSPPTPSSSKKRNRKSSPLPPRPTVIPPNCHLSPHKRRTTIPVSWERLQCVPPIPNVTPRIRLLQRRLELKNAYTHPDILYDEKVYSEHLKERKSNLRDERKRGQKQEEKEEEETIVLDNEGVEVESAVITDETDESMEHDHVDINGIDDEFASSSSVKFDHITVPTPYFRKLTIDNNTNEEDDGEQKKQHAYPPDSDDEREEFFSLKEISHRMSFCREYNGGYGHWKDVKK